MRALPKPTAAALAVHDSCVAGIADLAYRTRLGTVRHLVLLNETDFDNRASVEQLFSIPGRKYLKNEVVAGAATRSDMNKLYAQYMVPETEPARLHYNAISAIPGGRCPYCLIGHVSTLDHYLPKSRFPTFSVLPLNLVPSCKDCQSKKGRQYATTHTSQTLHPYYDHGVYLSDRWLYAEIENTNPVSATFYADPPSTWSPGQRDRVLAHVEGHGLASRYGVEAGTELSLLVDHYEDLRSQGLQVEIGDDLAWRRRTWLRRTPNCWQSALYDALSTDHAFLL